MPDKNTAQPVLLWANNHDYLQTWKSRPIKRDCDHVLKCQFTNYLQDYNNHRCDMWHLVMIRAYRML
ncbi:hypothetical protein DWG93_04735 [Escherichia coli]|nr:hypothetical protein [Escherichia coli]EFO1627116.1 hypothetical protein [Escherichia coli]